MKWIDSLIKKSKFPKVESVEHELKKIGLLRIVLGIFVSVRVFEIINSIYFFEHGLPLIAVVTFGLLLLFIVGFSVPLVTLGLIVSVRMLDIHASTNTLGTTIFIHLLFGMLLANSGRYYSVDCWISKKKNKFSEVFQLQYSIIGVHTKESLTKVYFFIFSLYALVSFGALGYHIQDYYWINALTIKSLLSNSYLSSAYESFRWVENSVPSLVSFLSVIGIIGQSLFQFTMIFLVFYKWGMQFVKWWGMQFFVISLLIINLSYLPHIEIVLWLMIFFPIKKVQKSVSIIYDDHCNLCKKAMLFFKKYNFNNRYEFIALSKNRALYEEYNLNEKEVKTYMVGWYKGKLLKGYDLYFRLILVNPLFWFLVPLFILGYLGGVGKIIYNWIAERRYKIFGQCELSFEDEIQSTHVPKQFTLKTTFVTYFYGVFLVLISLFILLKFPYVGDIVAPKVPASIKGISQKAIFRVGLEIPVVFNETDLSMGDNWMVIYRKEVDSEWRLVPIVAEDGHRLNYDGIDILHYTNHNSDFLYFGTSLRYRRSILTIDDFQEFHSNGYGKESIVKRISYDYKYMDLSNLVEYKVTVYSNNSSKVKHWVSIPERHEKVEMFKNEYVYDGVELKTK